MKRLQYVVVIRGRLGSADDQVVYVTNTTEVAREWIRDRGRETDVWMYWRGDDVPAVGQIVDVDRTAAQAMSKPKNVKPSKTGFERYPIAPFMPEPQNCYYHCDQCGNPCKRGEIHIGPHRCSQCHFV